jgi:dTDP-4-amino-4,6-dideoxygalactose transaminase
MTREKILFNNIHISGNEGVYLKELLGSNHLSGDGSFTGRVKKYLEGNITNNHETLLTHSCTAALEMMALLLDLKPGDEIIMPSYTFVSTATSFVLRGAIPVFIDIRPDTLNIDESKIESAITDRTRAIMVVHYAGVAAEMDSIKDIAKNYNLFVLEDAAQALMSSYKNIPLGTIGDLGAYSFHATKNIISGEGGALTIGNKNFTERAEIIREKGTNRKQFLRNEVDKYTWVDIGSSYLPSELIAAFLLAQLEKSKDITNSRLNTWYLYHSLLNELENENYLRRPIVPEECNHNGHLYYILLKDANERSKLIDVLKIAGISSVFHYIPLHSSPAGKKYSRHQGELAITNQISDTLLRLPLYANINEQEVNRVVEVIQNFFKHNSK